MNLFIYTDSVAQDLFHWVSAVKDDKSKVLKNKTKYSFRCNVINVGQVRIGPRVSYMYPPHQHSNWIVIFVCLLLLLFFSRGGGGGGGE